VRNLTKIFAGAILTLSSSVIAYVPDRCDWDDCGALARGESSSPIIISLIILGLIVFSSKK